MTEIRLYKRYKYAGDVFNALVEKAGFDIGTAARFLNKIEDAKVEEVVRCKDCKYYGTLEKGACAMFSDPGWYDEDRIIKTEPDDFCSYGKREEE